MIKSLISFILVFLMFLSSLGFVVYRLQKTEFVVSQARQVNLYDRLAGNVGGLIPNKQTAGYGLTSSDVADILKSSIDGEQFYGFLTNALNAYLPWLTGKKDDLSFSYNLTTIKQKLVDQAATKVRAKYDNLAICNQSQLRQWGFETGLPTCRLDVGTLQAKSVDNQIHQVASTLVEGLPDSITTGTPSTSLLKARIKISLVFKGINLIWGLTALLILLFLIVLRARALITIAVCLLLVGILQVAFSLVGWDWISRTLSDLISGLSDAKSVVPVSIDLISVILGAMKTTLGNISIGFLGSGVALLVFGIISRIHQPKLIEKLG